MDLCRNFLNRIASVIKALFWFLLYEIYQVGSFVALTSICIGFAAFIGGIHKYIWGESIPPFIITYLTLYFLALASQSHTFCHDLYLSSFWLGKETLYPCIMGLLPSIINGAAYIFAFSQLFYQYELVHTLPKSLAGENRTIFDRDEEMKKIDKGVIIKTNFELTYEDVNVYMVFFNLSISLLVYMTVKAMKRDIFERMRVPNPSSFNNCFATGFFTLLQLFLILLYSIPIAITCLLLKIVIIDAFPAIIITQFAACLMGFVGVYVEIRSPFPIKRHRPRFYAYENQLRARLIFLQFFLVPLIPFLFFQKGKVYPFNSYYEGFLLFNLTVGVCVLHVTKILFYSWAMNVQEVEVEVHVDGPEWNPQVVNLLNDNQNPPDEFIFEMKEIPSCTNNNNPTASQLQLKGILKNREPSIEVYHQATSLSSRTLYSVDQKELVENPPIPETDLHRSSATTTLGENSPSIVSNDVKNAIISGKEDDEGKDKKDPVLCFGPLDLSESHNQVRHLLHSEDAFVNRDLHADIYSGFQTDEDSDTVEEIETIKNNSKIGINNNEKEQSNNVAEDINKN